MNEILDRKNITMHKIKESMNKMSKKFLKKIIDYINLKFKVALAKNKIEIKKEKFITQSDMLEIYDRLKFYPKSPLKRSKLDFTPDNKKKCKNSKKKFEFKGTKGTFSSTSDDFESFAEDVSRKCKNHVLVSVDQKFKQVEPKLFESIQNSLKELGNKMQKSIDCLIQNNIYKLKLI